MGRATSNVARQAKRVLMPFIGLFAVLVLVPACQTIESGAPALPAGFLDAGIPDVELSVYAYMNPGYKFTVPTTVLVDGIEITDKVTVTKVIAAAPTNLESIGARVDFQNALIAFLLLQVVEQQVATSSVTVPWLYRDGPSIALVKGDTPWAMQMQQAFTSNATVRLQDTYPGTWEVMRLLPKSPPAPVVIAGFVRNVSGVIEGLFNTQSISIPGLSSALGLARVENVAFAVYANDLDDLSANIMDMNWQETHMGVIAVAKAGYPGPIINVLLKVVASRALLEDITIGEEKAHYRNLDNNAHLILKNFGGVLYFVFSPTREGAEQLMQAVIDNAA